MLGLFWISAIVSLFFPLWWIVTFVLLLIVMFHNPHKSTRNVRQDTQKVTEKRSDDDATGVAIVLAIASLLFLVVPMTH